MDRRLWLSGFLAGAFIGILALGMTEAPTTPPVPVVNKDPLPVQQNSFRKSLYAGVNRNDGMPTFEEMASAVAQSQGGQISLRQMQEIARITGGSPSDFERYASPIGTGPRIAPSQRIRSPEIYSIDRTVMASDLDNSASKDALARYSAPDEPPSASRNRLNARTGQPMISAGDGFTSGGSYYVPAGPDGAVNARTGEFTPLTNEM